MTEALAATALPPQLAAPHRAAGKHNMATAAFDELRQARLTGNAPAGDQLSFNDLIDTLNPLQHIPVVSEIYRNLTGDTLSPQARIAGGALYGGPIGLVASVASLAVSGGDGSSGLGDRIFAGIFGGEETETKTASISPAPAIAEEIVAASAARATAERTASLMPQQTAARAAPKAADKPAPAPVTGANPAMPQLSPEAFEALMGSFSDQPLARADNAALAPKMSLDIEGDEEDEDEKPADLLGAMGQALDKYEALKRPDGPALSAAY